MARAALCLKGRDVAFRGFRPAKYNAPMATQLHCPAGKGGEFYLKPALHTFPGTAPPSRFSRNSPKL